MPRNRSEKIGIQRTKTVVNSGSWRHRTLDLIAAKDGAFRLRLHGDDINSQDRSRMFPTYKSAHEAFQTFPGRFTWQHNATSGWFNSPESYAQK